MAWFQTIPDSDQSISDDEEPDHNSPNKFAKLEKKEFLQISSRLEMLKGANVNACNKEHNEVKTTTVPKVSVNGGANEAAKDDVYSLLGNKQDELYLWSAVSKEAEALMQLNEKTSCSSSLSSYSNVKRSTKGAKGKGKPKFSFRLPTHKEGSSSLSVYKDDTVVSLKILELPERFNAIEPRNEDHLDGDLNEDIQGEEELEIMPRNEEHSDVELVEDFEEDEDNCLKVVPFEAKAVGHGSVGRSMAELLDGLHDKTTRLRGSSKKLSRKQRKREQPYIKCVSPVDDGSIDSESSPEHLGHELLSDVKTNDQSLKLTNPKMKRQTLLERFQEAMSDRILVPVPKTLRNGLFGKLQQVAQSEKERDMEFLKKIQEGASENEPNCMDVQILLKYLDAKLTVCHCFFGNSLKELRWPESSKGIDDEGHERTIIFNPRVCNDIDLDIGKWIRIHPPWKEIQVGTDQHIILSTYFSNIYT